MLIQKDDPRIAEKNQNALNQMQSIAYFFGRRFGKESMPAQFQAFAVKPVLPKQSPPAPKKEETPAEGGAKPAGAAQPADGAKPADGKNKGEAPATPADAPKSDAKAAGDGKAK